MPFKKGNPGKPEGAVTKVNQKARELFVSIMEGQVEHIESALEELRSGKDKTKYLDCLAKFFPYFVPKKVELDIPKDITVTVKRK